MKLLISPKGFPPGQGCKWETGLLKQILTIVGKIDPEAEINYNIRDAIHIKPSKCKAFWLRIKTKQAEALEVICFCKKGQFNLERLEGLAPETQLVISKPKIDDAQLHFTKIKDLDPIRVAKFLKEVREGLLSAFGMGG